MKKRLWIYGVSALIVIILVFTSFAIIKKDRAVDYIQFPQMSEHKHDNTTTISFELDSKNKNLLGQKLPKYKIKSSRKDDEDYYDGCVFKITDSLLYSKETNNSASSKGINNSASFVTKKDDEYTRYYYDDSNSELIIYKNGSFAFRMLSPKEETLTLTDEEVIKIAEDFVKSSGLVPSDFIRGEKLGKTVINKTDTIMKSVGFYRNINDCEVYGKSEIVVEVRASGITAFSSVYSECEDYKTVKCMSYEDVKNINVLEKGQLSYDASKLGNKATNIVFKEVETAYYDSPINQPELGYIKPIYVFKGLISDEYGNSTECAWSVEAESNQG